MATDLFWVTVEAENGENVVRCRGEDGCAQGNGVALYYPSAEARNAAWPFIKDIAEKAACDLALAEININAGLDVQASHTRKAEEARRVRKGEIEPDDIPHIHAEHVRTQRPITVIADEIWAKYMAEVAIEDQRIAARQEIQ